MLSLSQFHPDIIKFRNSFRTRRKLNRHTKAVIPNNTQKHQLPPQIIARVRLHSYANIIRRFEIFVFRVHFDKRQLSYPAPYLGLVYSHACKLNCYHFKIINQVLISFLSLFFTCNSSILKYAAKNLPLSKPKIKITFKKKIY